MDFAGRENLSPVNPTRLFAGMKGPISMELKVVCQCGQKFKFEVEPVNGQMPRLQSGWHRHGKCHAGRDSGQSTTAISYGNFASAPSNGPALGRLAHQPRRGDRDGKSAVTPRPTVRRAIAPLHPAPVTKHQMEWYEHIWCALPLGLSAIGGDCGGLAWACNRQVFREMPHPVLRYVVTGLISAAACGVYLAVAVPFFRLIHQNG